jgi:isocitrate/isopropylmalate dehydrogenase
MFEPVHESALDIFGKGIANSLAMIRCGAMMLDFLHESDSADLILRAIKAVAAEERTLMPDLGDAQARAKQRRQ